VYLPLRRKTLTRLNYAVGHVREIPSFEAHVSECRAEIKTDGPSLNN
jgi:hypothetical protein